MRYITIDGKKYAICAFKRVYELHTGTGIYNYTLSTLEHIRDRYYKATYVRNNDTPITRIVEI